MKQRWLISALALLAVVLSTGIVQAQSANRGRSNFDWIVARAITVTADLIVSDDATVTVDLTVAGDTALSGATTLGGAVTQSDGNLTVADDLTISKQITFTVGTNGIITPTGSFQVITASAARGVGTIVAGAAGDTLLMVNTGSNTITLTDTGTLRLSGNAALAQNDTILLVSDGVNWIQIAPEGDN
jgi:hypothetical protein